MQKKKVKKVDKGMCDRFCTCADDTGDYIYVIAQNCGLISDRSINEIKRHVTEPSKKMLVHFCGHYGYSADFKLLGRGSPRL